MALLRAGLERQRGVAILEATKTKLRGVKDMMTRSLVLRQPIWKFVTVTGLAIVLITALVITLPSLNGQSVYAQAADIAQNSPEVRAALGGGEVQEVKVIKVVDGKGTVVCKGELGTITAEVDLDKKVVTEVVPMPELSGTDEQRAVEIARADSRVKELLDKGANIGRVSPMYSFGTRINPQTGETEEFSQALVMVEIDWVGKSWTAEVDLSQGKVDRLVEKTLMSTESYSDPQGRWGIEYFKIEKGTLEEKAKP